MGPEQTVEASFDALFIDDVCSFLTPRLVTGVKKSGGEVIGVFAPADGSDAKRRLLECGISDVIEMDAPPDELMEKVIAALAHRIPVADDVQIVSTGWSIGLTGVADGVGTTEVATTLAAGLADDLKVALVDVDPTWPSIAQRLDLPLHPNIRTALDMAAHGSGDIEAATHVIGDMAIVGGVADQGSASPLTHTEVAMLFDALSGSTEVIVADLGPLQLAVRGAFRGFDTVALVGTGDPIGVARLLRSADHLLDLVGSDSLVLVANKTSRRRFYESEIRREVQHAFPDLPLVVLPFDRRLTDSMWEGQVRQSGPFAKAVGRMATLITEGLVP
jgi:MinD-like ATPase involved in chromosome partitioning or flagellar assembly